MGTLGEYFPRHAWVAVLTLAAVAAIGLFVPPSVGAAVGLSATQYIAVIAVVELCCAIGIGALVVYYRNPDAEFPEWKFEP